MGSIILVYVSTIKKRHEMRVITWKSDSRDTWSTDAWMDLVLNVKKVQDSKLDLIAVKYQ